MRKTADVIIIGGGVIGASIAFHLAQLQAGRVLVVERDSLGSGSTGLSVASVDGLTMRPHAVKMFADSTRFFAECDERLGMPCEFVRTGSILLAGAAQERDLDTAVARMQAAGINSRLLSPGDLADLEPGLALAGVAAVSLTPEAGYADPVLTTQAFAGAARRLGTELWQGVEVGRLLIEAGQVKGVETAVGPVHAPVIVVAAGPWSADLLRTAGIDLPLQPVAHPVVCLRRPPGVGQSHRSLLDLTTGIYARPETGDLILLGSIEPDVGYDAVNVHNGAGYVEDSYIMWTMKRMVRRYPALEAAELRKGWAGLMTISPDWQPLIGGWPDAPGLFIAAGFSGQGFQICPAAGDMLARMILGDAAAVDLLRPFAPGRFITGRPAGAGLGLLGLSG